MILHEFTTKSVAGYYLLITFVSYGSFLTFSVMIDSMLDEETAAQTNGIHLVNKFYRISMHIGAIVLVAQSYFINGCREEIYPHSFLWVAIYTLVNAAFTHYLHIVHTRHPEDFLFNPDKLPPMSINNLRYNKELFKKQMDWLWIFTLIFAIVSTVLISLGAYISSNSALAAEAMADVT